VRTSNIYPMRRLLSLLVLAAVVLYGLGIWLFLLRKDDRLPNHTADAVVLLAGSKKRLPVALDLMRRHAARTLLVSETSQKDDPARYALCHGAKPKGYELICRNADPFSTRGEARLAGQLAQRNHWLSLIVVSSRYHLYRAKELFGRCTDATLIMRGTDGDPWTYKAVAVPLEWLKLARSATFARGC
jgi:uncharacterized SAM-binding protein YcdF (DUF218 family)